MTTKNNRRDHTNVLPRQSQKHTLKGQWFLFNMPLIVATLLCFLRFPQANSQKTECSCTPLKYRWILNLTNPCPPLFQKNSRGIKDLFCFVDVDVDETDDIEIDETPVDVSSYILIELRTDPDKVDEKYNLTLSDGDPILFESRTLTVEDYISEAFSAEIVGVNAAGYQVKLSVYIEVREALKYTFLHVHLTRIQIKTVLPTMILVHKYLRGASISGGRYIWVVNFRK